jgi:3-deoxy-D-manno-octulosonic acid kinase
MKRLRVPPGFIEHRNHNQRWWVKAEWTHFFPIHCDPFHTTLQTPLVVLTGGGRGASYRIRLDDGSHAIVRPYRRGGFVRHFVSELYWGRPFRPFRELLCTEHARQHGVPTVEVLAAAVEQTVMGLYRGVFISREAEGFVNLWEWLQRKPEVSQRAAVFAAVAHTIAQLHQAGVKHADLNLTNILLDVHGGVPFVRIIDFDRARSFSSPLSPYQTQGVLRRLRRSFLKLDPRRQLHSLTEEHLLCSSL